MENTKICIIGLGYVGLPLAIEFGKKLSIIGFDINKKRIEELKNNFDSTCETSKEDLKNSNIEFTSDPSDIKKSNFIIIAVPTPITEARVPNLNYVKSATEIVAKNMNKGAIVVYESTVYPGATEEECVPILEKFSGFKLNSDFKVGYSPERINPGDRDHTVEKIIKIVSGSDLDSLKIISKTYQLIIKAGIFEAKNIKTAEAAKVIENIQRDLNVALINELSLIFKKLNINTMDVINAASTKWNFHKYTPGLVGGHCIGVDPYYLTYKAQQLGHNPEIILAGRNINEFMATHVANLVLEGLSKSNKPLKNCNVLILGLTFKDNITDTRNSKIKNVIKELKKYSITPHSFDPKVNKEITEKRFAVKYLEFDSLKNYKFDSIIYANDHLEFSKMKLNNPDFLKFIMENNSSIIDLKNIFDQDDFMEKNIKILKL